MMKRTYSIIVYGNEQTDQMLILNFIPYQFF